VVIFISHCCPSHLVSYMARRAPWTLEGWKT